MKKNQWKNLYHALRWMKRFCTKEEVMGWIGFYSVSDQKTVDRVIKARLKEWV